jgi:hypothetical protein
MKTSLVFTALSLLALTLAPINAESEGARQLRTGDDVEVHRELKLFSDVIKRHPLDFSKVTKTPTTST